MINTYDFTLYTLIAENKYLFEVPNYQRHYVWTEKEIELFLNDGKFCMDHYAGRDEKYEHYAGQMIFRKSGEERDRREILEIIDGQQRLITFMLLNVAVIERLKSLDPNLQEIEEIRKKYLLSCSGMNTCECKKKLKLSKRDSDFWDRLLEGEIPPRETGMLESQQKLLEAYEVIEKYLAEMTNGIEADKKVDTLLKLVEALANSFRIVMLLSEEPGHEFALFQIVNDRGLPLTTGELLKARTIELLTSRKKTERRERIILDAEEIWADILQDDGNTTENFLTWHYIAILGKKPECVCEISMREQYERDIFHCLNQREISMDAQDKILKELELLRQDVQMCRTLEKGEFPIECKNKNLNLLFHILICNMKNIFAIPIYLRLFNGRKEKEALRLAELLTPMFAKTYFQAKCMGNLADESVRNCYLQIWGKIDKEKVSVEEIREELEQLLNKERCKEEFYRKIEQNVYDRSTGNFNAKFLLLMIELQYLKEGEDNRANFGDDSVEILFDRLSIEHILHKGVSEQEVSSDLYASIHKIGNLTLLGEGLNSREKAKSFEKKREHYRLSPYVMTRKVGGLEAWRLKEFKERQAELTVVLKRAFKL